MGRLRGTLLQSLTQQLVYGGLTACRCLSEEGEGDHLGVVPLVGCYEQRGAAVDARDVRVHAGVHQKHLQHVAVALQ